MQWLLNFQQNREYLLQRIQQGDGDERGFQKYNCGFSEFN